MVVDIGIYEMKTNKTVLGFVFHQMQLMSLSHALNGRIDRGSTLTHSVLP